jgi:hypothetical protein
MDYNNIHISICDEMSIKTNERIIHGPSQAGFTERQIMLIKPFSY